MWTRESPGGAFRRCRRCPNLAAMAYGVLIAANHDHLSRAGDHVVVVGVALLIALVGALVYWLVRLVGKSRSERTRPDQEVDRSGEA